MSTHALGEGTAMAARVSGVVRMLMGLARESQSDVAKVLGVPQSAVSARLRGQTKWTVDDLEVLATHYGRSITVFFLDPDAFLSPAEPRRGLTPNERSSCSIRAPRVPRVTSGAARTRLHRPDRVSAAAS